MIRGPVTAVLASLFPALALTASGQPVTPAGGFSELYRAEVVGSSDVEVVMGLVEREAGSTSPKHYHPGGEFGFVLDGVVSVQVDGKPTTTLRAGDAFYQPPGEAHIISTGPSGARAVVFRVLEKGQPMVVTVE